MTQTHDAPTSALPDAPTSALPDAPTSALPAAPTSATGFVGTGETQDQHLEALGRYEWGWSDSDVAGAGAQRGLTPAIVANISGLKSEPQW